MKKLHIAMAIAASLSSAAIAQAQDYQIEGGLGYAVIDFDVADNAPTILGLDGTYHIESVSTSGVVLNEAAFVGRNNNINAMYLQLDPDISGTDTFDITDIGVEWWFEDIYAALNVNDDDGFGTNTIRLGYMVQENTRVNLIMETGDQDEDGMGLEAKYVGALGDNTINLEASYVDTDGDAATMLGGDFYFTNEFSAGIDLFDSGVDGDDSSTILNVKNFFTPTISGELEYVMGLYGDKDDSAIAIRAAMRF